MYSGDQLVTLVVDGLTFDKVIALRALLRTIYGAQLDDVIAVHGMIESNGEYDAGARVQVRAHLVLLVSSYLAQFNTAQHMSASDQQIASSVTRGFLPQWIFTIADQGAQ